MTPQEIAAARPWLLDFAAEMLGGLARKTRWLGTARALVLTTLGTGLFALLIPRAVAAATRVAPLPSFT